MPVAVPSLLPLFHLPDTEVKVEAKQDQVLGQFWLSEDAIATVIRTEPEESKVSAEDAHQTLIRVTDNRGHRPVVKRILRRVEAVTATVIPGEDRIVLCCSSDEPHCKKVSCTSATTATSRADFIDRTATDIDCAAHPALFSAMLHSCGCTSGRATTWSTPACRRGSSTQS